MFALPFAAVRGLCERKYRWGARKISCKTSRVTLRMKCGRVALSVQENQLTQDLELLIHDKKHVGIEIKYYNLDSFKKQVDAKLYRS